MQLVVTEFAIVSVDAWNALGPRRQLTLDDNVVRMKDSWLLDLLDGDFVGSLVYNCSHASHDWYLLSE